MPARGRQTYHACHEHICPGRNDDKRRPRNGQALSCRRPGRAFRKRRGDPFRGHLRALRRLPPVRRVLPCRRLAQIIWAAVAVLRLPRWWLWLGIAGNAAVLAVYLASRTTGLPFGPDQGHTEPFGAL